MTVEGIIIGIVVIAAAIYAGRAIWLKATRKPDCCGTGMDKNSVCDGCKLFETCNSDDKSDKAEIDQ